MWSDFYFVVVLSRGISWKMDWSMQTDAISTNNCIFYILAILNGY